jgi:hypothetical protein
MNSDLAGVVAANEGQKAVAETDASHDNVMSDVLMVLRATDPARHKDAATLLKDDMATVVQTVRDTPAANVSPRVTAAATALLPTAEQFAAKAKATAVDLKRST